MGLDHEHEEPGEQEREDRRTAQSTACYAFQVCAALQWTSGAATMLTAPNPTATSERSSGHTTCGIWGSSLFGLHLVPSPDSICGINAHAVPSGLVLCNPHDNHVKQKGSELVFWSHR